MTVDSGTNEACPTRALRKDKVRIRFAELQARVEKARFEQGSYKVRRPATTGFNSPRSRRSCLDFHPQLSSAPSAGNLFA
jgi:hypothetical protein